MAFLITTPKLSCKIKDTTGIECPGCGIQRSFELLINGHFVESFKMYPALLPLLFTLGILAYHTFRGNLKTLAILKYSFIISVAIMLISYILKFI
ncbi:DUF2752 domain-containing protein [Moheibacter stercoris]|uniref:DUF2752 domain-containing protein n=1 Tax=Moheibacter stercoris TaxID=1628251 RepID=A0ABV2LU67_9FLAO